MPNALIESLSTADRKALEPHLRHISFEQKHILFHTGDEIDTVCFPTSAVISLVVILEDGVGIEASMVGRDGVVGAASALDGKIAFHQAIVELPGDALVCSPQKLKEITLASPTLLALLMRHEQATYAQAQQSAACFARHHVQARMCRWMLRASDLAQSDTLSFTQELLAQMLGVRRNTVTPVAYAMQQTGIIKYTRGIVQIMDREALEDSACECYKTIKQNYDQLTRRSNL